MDKTKIEIYGTDVNKTKIVISVNKTKFVISGTDVKRTKLQFFVSAKKMIQRLG